MGGGGGEATLRLSIKVTVEKRTNTGHTNMNDFIKKPDMHLKYIAISTTKCS